MLPYQAVVGFLIVVDPINRIPCMVGQRVRLVCLKDVEYVATSVASVQVFTAEGALYTEITLKVLEERAGLLRCHKQYLINMECISAIVFLANGAAEIRTFSHQKIPVSRRYLKKTETKAVALGLQVQQKKQTRRICFASTAQRRGCGRIRLSPAKKSGQTDEASSKEKHSGRLRNLVSRRINGGRRLHCRAIILQGAIGSRRSR